MGCEHVWDKDVEPWRPREYIKCIKCGKVFRDFENYVVMLTKDMRVESVLDVGTGKKGPVAEKYWVDYKHIKVGYVCDIWVIKENLNPIWKKLKMNALDLLGVLKPKSVDVVQAFGFLEHLDKSDGFDFLKIAEKLAKKLAIVSGALCIHAPDKMCGDDPYYKARLEGNPYHVYRSIWGYDDFTKGGWDTDLEYYNKGESYMGDVIAWKLLKK